MGMIPFGTARATLPAFPLYRGGPHSCSYLPGRTATDLFTIARRVEGAEYQAMMDQGFRRSGRVIYRPECRGCRECVPIRVPVAAFRASRSQRRVQRRNADVGVEIGPPRCTDEKYRLFVDYLRFQHDGAMGEDRGEFERFLYDSPTDTLEMTYRIGNRLGAVGIVDATPACLSSVYFYFAPQEARRSLGVFGALQEIEECRVRGLPYWYVGYYVRESAKMNYKAAFGPHELLGPDGVWRGNDE